MATINQINCASKIKNTGSCPCSFDPKNFVKWYFAPLGTELTDAQLADDTIQATLEGLTLAAQASRLYPSPKVIDITDNTEDPVMETYGYGTQKKVRDGKYNLIFRFEDGGLNTSNALQSFDGQQGKYGVYFVDADNVLIGRSKVNGDGDTVLAPIPLETIVAYPFKVATGSTAANYRLGIIFDPVYLNEQVGYKDASESGYLLIELSGLEDVVLTAGTITATTTQIKAVTSCGANLGATYGTELAVAGAWSGYNITDSAAVVPSGVTYNTNTGFFTLTYTSQTTADQIRWSLATPAALAALDVVGYESPTPIVVTIP